MGYPKDVLRFPDDGKPIAVLRPSNPQNTLMMAHIAIEHQNLEALKEACSGEMTMKGWLVKRNGKFLIVDENGLNPIEPEPGDIFASEENLTRMN